MAIALLLHPRLLLVDEPSLGLDPRMVEVVFDTILAINREGTTVLMVEQNAKKALAISHRGFVLELGRNRFEGTGQELLDNPEVRQHYLGGWRRNRCPHPSYRAIMLPLLERGRRMKALIAAANTASLTLLGAGVAYAGAPEYFKIPPSGGSC